MNINSTFQPNQAPQQQLAHAEQLIQQLMHQTQQASMQYQQLLNQEKSNAMQLEQIAQREHQAAAIIQNALQGHQTAIQQLQQINAICQQISHSASTASSYNTSSFPVHTQTNTQSHLHNSSFPTGYSN